MVTTVKTSNTTKKENILKSILALGTFHFIVIWKYTITFKFLQPVSEKDPNYKKKIYKIRYIEKENHLTPESD
jgi:hypothetical protein